MMEFAEDFDSSPTLSAIKQICLEKGMYVIGSIPRKKYFEGKTLYFISGFVINPEGKLHQQMDKIHLFDLDVPGKEPDI